MKNKQTNRHNSGTSLIEVIIALVISSIVLTTAFKMYNYLTQSTHREKVKSEMQRDIINVSNIIERDIRMAGLGLPGNGVSAQLSNSTSDQLSLFTNENRTETRLKKDAQPCHYHLYVADTAGFVPNGWVCIADESVDTTYRCIFRIGVNNSGMDTLWLYHMLVNGPYDTLQTKIYPAQLIRYHITTSPTFEFKRTKNATSVVFSSKLDSMDVIPKRADGTSLPGGSINNASVITIVIGGYVGTSGNRFFMADSSEINIRNGG